jgi:hypothetical protein
MKDEQVALLQQAFRVVMERHRLYIDAGVGLADHLPDEGHWRSVLPFLGNTKVKPVS